MSIADIITDTFSNFFEGITEGICEVPKSFMDVSFTLFPDTNQQLDIDLGNFPNTLFSSLQWPLDMLAPADGAAAASPLYVFADHVSGWFMAVGTSLLVLFLFLDLLKRVLETDNLQWTQIFYCLLKFVTFKALMDGSLWLVKNVTLMGSNWLTYVKSFGTGAGLTGSHAGSVGEAISEALFDASMAIANDNTIVAMFVALVGLVVFFMMYITIIGSFVGIIAQVLMLSMKLTLTYAFAPIPLAMYASENGGSTGKKFINYTLSIILEVSMVAACVCIYRWFFFAGLQNVGAAENTGFGPMVAIVLVIMISNAMMQAALGMCSQMAERFTGA